MTARLHFTSSRFAMAAASRPTGKRKAFSRLPRDVVPSNYALRLKPDLAAFTFDGHEYITVQV